MDNPSEDEKFDSDSDSDSVEVESEISVEVDASDSQPQDAEKSIWRRHPGWILFGIGFSIYMIIVPTVALIIDWFTPVQSGELLDMTMMEWIRLRTVSGVVTLMFLGVGASIGSFLNVVIYRLPRFRPLLWPPSACGNCKTRLRGEDNIPVIAWLKLGGCCRYCGVSISARYPVVEAIVGLLFVLFFFRELLSGGANLPVREPNLYNGVVWILLYTKWDLVSLYFYHMILLVILLAWGMINYDRFRVPARSVLLCLPCFMILASVFPHLNPAHASWNLGLLPPSVFSSLGGSLVGFAIGWFGGRFLKLPAVQASSLASEMPSELSEANENVAELLQPAEASIPLEDSMEASKLPVQHEQDDAGVRTAQDLELDPAAVDGTDATEEGQDVVDPQGLYGSLANSPECSVDTGASLALVGAAMGTQATIWVTLLTLGLIALYKFVEVVWLHSKQEMRRYPATIFVFASTVILLLFWDTFHLH